MNLHLNWRLNGNDQNFKIRNSIRTISHYSDSLMYPLSRSQHIRVTEKKSMPISTSLTDYYTIIHKSGKAKAMFDFLLPKQTDHMMLNRILVISYM
jgi:hypothetical protein